MQPYPFYKKILIYALLLAGLFFTIPNLFSEDFSKSSIGSFFSDKRIEKGLDLEGGSYLLLEVDTKEIKQKIVSSVKSDVENILLKKSIEYKLIEKENELYFEFSDGLLNNKGNFFDEVRKVISIHTFSKNLDGFTVFINNEFLNGAIRQAAIKTSNVIRRRINQSGVKEPIVQVQGNKRIIVQLPGLENPSKLKELVSQTAKMTFHIVNENINPYSNSRHYGNTKLPVKGSSEYLFIKNKAVVDGDSLVDASPSFENGFPVVSFRFNNKGALKFAKITQENQGKRLAVVIDNEIISAPSINTPILGGSGVITGNFSVDESNNLALMLKSGSLPVSINILEDKVVGAGLGQDSVNAGKIASIISIIVVIVFMVTYYKRFGVYCGIVLLLNLMLIMASFTIMGVVLTMSGIAALILTVGMAVDANVLIFERIREEQKSRKTFASACDFGFKKAFYTIMDSNITGLISSVILMLFGSGPIKGFGTTLTIGIILSMFSSIILTSYFVRRWVNNKNNVKKLPW